MRRPPKKDDGLTPEEKLAILIEQIKPNPAVLALPHFPTKAQKQWWNKYIGKKFQDKVAKKGKKDDNGVTWVRDRFLGEFCQENYPKLTEEERGQYYRLVGEKFYQYLTNHSYHGTTGVTVKAKPAKVRAYGYDVWRREKPEEFEQMKTQFLKTHPKHNEKNVGTRRSLYSALFAHLPLDVQKDYSIRASDSLKASQALNLLFGEDRNRYNENIPRRLKAFMKEVETCAKGRIISQVLTEESDGSFMITSVASESLQEFQKSPEIGRALHALKTWVETSVAKGKHVHGGAPNIAIYPDQSKDNFPCLPNYVGVTLAEAQKLLRVYITMVWMYMGGIGKVPWEEISQDVETWIDPERMPAGALWKDPGSQPLTAVLVWLDYFIGCQDGTVPDSKRFQFSRVIAGTRPIAPGRSQEASRERVRRNEKDTWVLVFEDTVSKCHHPDGMRYPEMSQAYAVFLATGNCPPPSSRHDLLPGGGSAPTSLIDDDAKAKLLEYADQLPDDVGGLMRKLLETVNEHQSHYPASNTDGAWADKSPLPALLPDAPPANFPAALRDFILDFWLPSCYFQAPTEPGDASTIAWFEAWQRKMLATGVLYHEPSGTMLGGHSGVVWVIVALIKLLLNFSALRGDITHPVELPAEYDVSRVPLGEWKRLLDWCRNWLSRLESDVKVLSKSSEERCKTSTTQSPAHSTSLTPPPLDAPAPAPAPALAPAQPPKSRKARPKMKLAPTRKRRSGSDSEDPDDDNIPSDSDGEEVGGEEVDYEKLDMQAESDGLSESENGDADPGDIGMGGKGDTWDTAPAPPAAPSPNDPNPVPSPSSGSSPSAAHVFGPFHALPVLKKSPPFPKDFNAIISGLKQCNLDILDALREWYGFCMLHARPDREAAEAAAATAAASLPTEYQPLFKFVHTASMDWRHAAKVAPRIFDCAQEFSMLIRQSIPFTASARRFRNISDMIDKDLWDLNRLEEMESEVNKGLAEIRWLHKELVAFEQLSSEWADKLANIWPPSKLPDDPAALSTLAAMLLQWAEASECLGDRQLNSRALLWKQLGGPLDEGRADAPLGYRFGCPSTNGELESLKECLRPNRPRAPSTSSRAVSDRMPTPVNDIADTASYVGDPALETGGLEGPTAQYAILTSRGTTEVPNIPPSHPPSTDAATKQQPDCVDTPATETRRKRRKGEQPLASDAVAPTRLSTRSKKAREPERPQEPGKTRAAKRQAAAAEATREVKRRKTGRK